ncbi:MAG: hypothetical protein J6I85_02875 [Clostridia bacterium]|nr:hypothetical protein [Clostridia bacterium]
MSINCEILDLIEFFEKEPRYIYGEESGEFLITREKNGFELLLTISLYEKIVSISLSYNENLIYNQIYKNVNRIFKSDNILVIEIEKKQVIKILDNKYFQIIVSEN